MRKLSAALTFSFPIAPLLTHLSRASLNVIPHSIFLPTQINCVCLRILFLPTQNALDSRGLPASGKKQELQERLADLLWSEQMGPEQGPQQASGQLQDGDPDQDLAVVLSQLDEVPYTELKRLCSARGLSASGKKAELQVGWEVG